MGALGSQKDQKWISWLRSLQRRAVHSLSTVTVPLIAAGGRHWQVLLVLQQMTAGGFPALAAGSAKVGAGDDTGLLGFVPKSVKICKGDKITWTSGKAAPHNIVFDEENVPAGVDAKALGQPEGEYL